MDSTDTIFNKDKITKLLSIKHNNKFIQRKSIAIKNNTWRIVNTYNNQEQMNANLNKLSSKTYNIIFKNINILFKDSEYDDNLINIYFDKTINDMINTDLYINILIQDETLKNKYLEKFYKLNTSTLDLSDKNNYVNIDKFSNYHKLTSYLFKNSLIDFNLYRNIYNNLFEICKNIKDEYLLNIYIKSLHNLILYSIDIIKSSEFCDIVKNNIDNLINITDTNKKIQFLVMDISELF